MNGADYIATVRLSDKGDDTLAAPGESCDRVPPASLPWLLEQGLIVTAPAAADEPEELDGETHVG